MPNVHAWAGRLSAIAAIALSIASFLPWYAVHWSTHDLTSGQTTQHSVTASAWTSSTAWTAGVLLACAAAAGHAYRVRNPRLSPLRRLSVAAVLVTAGYWLAIPSTTATDAALEFRALPASGTALGIITRDALTNRQTNVAWGFYVGFALMIVIAICTVIKIRPETTKDRPPM